MGGDAPPPRYDTETASLITNGSDNHKKLVTVSFKKMGNSMPPMPPPRRRRFFYLPTSVLNTVFEYLWAVDLGSVSCVCRSWMVVTQNDHLWQNVASLYGVDVKAVTLALSSANGTRSRLRPSSASTKRGFWKAKVKEACDSSTQKSQVQAKRSTSLSHDLQAKRNMASPLRFESSPTVPPNEVDVNTHTPRRGGKDGFTSRDNGHMGQLDGDSPSMVEVIERNKENGPEGTKERRAKFSDNIKRHTYVPEAVSAVEQNLRPETQKRNTFSSGLRAPLQREAAWQRPARSVDEELDYMAHHVYATAPTISEAEKVQLVEDQMTMLRRRLQAAGAGVDASVRRLATLTSLSNPIENSLRAQLEGTKKVAAAFNRMRLKDKRNEEFMKRRAFIDSFEAIVVRSILTKEHSSSTSSSSPLPPMLTTFPQMESHVLAPQVFGSSSYMRWNLMKRTVPIDDRYYDVVDAILDAPFSCDTDGTQQVDDEVNRYSGEWWYIPALGGELSIVVSAMKAVLVLMQQQQRRNDQAKATYAGAGYDDVLAVLSEASGRR